MRRLLSLGLLLLCTSPLCAEWRLEGVSRQPARGDAVSFLTVRLREEWPVSLNVILLDRRKTTLRVVPLGRSETVAQAARAAGGLAAVNGGYFHEDGTPLGLVLADGRELHPRQKAKLLSGLLVVTPKGVSLLRTAEFRPGPAVRQALQAGPFLVDKGRVVPGLNATRAAERTVLLADERGVIGFLTTPPLTLSAAGRLLATPGILPGVKVERALNLDGGSSTALWVDTAPAPFSRPEWKPVRNAVVAVPN